MTNEKENAYDPNTLPDLLPLYYKRLFPYGPYYRWLHYGGVPKNYFHNREFSFTLKDDVYIRYQSFADQAELEQEVQKRCPYKIDIGAVFSCKPKEHKTVKASAFTALEKELVFDIDMTDYDDVRYCCSGADICLKCWPLMTIAVRIIDTALRDDFGFDNRLWVYSGRRGVHCWVCDEAARKLSQSARSAIAEYLSVVKGGENQLKKVSLFDSLHPSIQRARDICETSFEKYVKKQDLFGDEEKEQKILQLVPDPDAIALFKQNIEQVEKKEKRTLPSVARWRYLGDCLEKHINKCKRTRDEIMLQYIYPRLDVNVSKGVNHLLKSPFCVHPKTGRVCVPMDAENIEHFDPFAVPTISQICDELNNIERKEGDAKRIKDYRLTSIKQCIEVFDKFVKKLEESRRGMLIEQSDATNEF